MTESNGIKRQRERAKRAEDLRDSFEKAVLKDMQNPDEAARRAACKLYNDRLAEKCDALQAELDELKKAAGETVPRADYDAAITEARTARVAVEQELQKLKDTMASALEKERMALQNKTVDLEMRENKVQAAIAEAKQKFDTSGIAAVIEELQKMVRLGQRTAPDFFKSGIHNPLFWATFPEWSDERAAIWCRLAKDSTFKEDAAVELLHRGTFCSYCGWSKPTPKVWFSDEAASYARAYLSSKGWTQEEIGAAVRQLIDSHNTLDAGRARPNVYDLEEQSRWLHPTPVQRVQRNMVDESVQRPPAFVPDSYPYCQD
jgi:hypothetical protein